MLKSVTTQPPLTVEFHNPPKMPSLRQSLITLGLAMPIALACVGKNAMPKANKTISNDRPIEVAAGEVFDGKGARYDRGTGSCNSQKEGGKSSVAVECIMV